MSEEEADGSRRQLPIGIRTRLADTPRHYRALGYGLSAFEGASAYIAAATSNDPAELSRIYAVERPFELLENYVIELGRMGLEEASIVQPGGEISGRKVLRALADEGVISQALRDRLSAIHDLRNQLAHEYPDVRASRVYDAAAALQPLVQQFVRRYLEWLATIGFTVPRTPKAP